MFNERKTIFDMFAFFMILMAVLVNLWCFSRFTVDDAFISWRYGKNFIDFGVWAYNPTYYDLTQAYTNPLFAFLSTIPSFFNIDVVLFFKLFSIVNVVIFFAYLARKTRSYKLLLSFLAMPATIIHLFGGLETFVFASLLTVLFISFFDKQFKLSLVVTLLLFLTRPEAWLLSALTPLYWLICGLHLNFSNPIKSVRTVIKAPQKNWLHFFAALCVLVSFLSVYLLISKWHFGYFFPNTFYVKHNGEFQILSFFGFLIYLLPLGLLVLLNRKNEFFIIFLFCLIVMFTYADSQLAMNYAERFLFHIFAPVFMILLYLKQDVVINNISVSKIEIFSKEVKIKPQREINIAASVILFLFFLGSTLGSNLKLISYYPRALDSHAKLGKALNHLNEVSAFSFGDAGMTSYYSNKIALDNIGLASALMAHNNMMVDKILDQYQPDIIVFHSNPNALSLDKHNQQPIYNWIQNKPYQYLCRIYWRSSYTLAIYAKQNFESIYTLCASSKEVNDLEERVYLQKNLLKSPLNYWHE